MDNRAVGGVGEFDAGAGHAAALADPRRELAVGDRALIPPAVHGGLASESQGESVAAFIIHAPRMPAARPDPTIERMSELPPDPARLHAILAHLDRQLADTDTLRTYLRLQREEVLRALQTARQPTRPPRPTQRQVRPALAPAPFPNLTARQPNGPTGAGDGYMLEIKRHPKDPEPAVLHVDSCTRATQKTSPITPDEFRVALRDTEYVQTCRYCRPEDEPDYAIA